MKTTILAIAALTAAFTLPAQDGPTAQGKAATAGKADQAWTTIAAWPVEGCIVTGRALAKGKAKTFEVDGRTYKTCCGRCQKKVENDPAKFAAILDKAIVAVQRASYPLETCPLTKRKLNAKARDVVVKDTLVRVCCGRCAKKAPSKGEELAAAVNAASHKAQAASYPLTTCPISGEELGDDPAEVMYGGTLLRFCCGDCVDEFKKAPEKSLAALAKATKAADGEAKKDGGKN